MPSVRTPSGLETKPRQSWTQAVLRVQCSAIRLSVPGLPGTQPHGTILKTLLPLTFTHHPHPGLMARTLKNSTHTGSQLSAGKHFLLFFFFFFCFFISINIIIIIIIIFFFFFFFFFLFFFFLFFFSRKFFFSFLLFLCLVL